MKNGIVLVTLALLLCVLPVSAQALSINFDLTFTADNIVNMWETTGDFTQDLSSYNDGNWGDWTKTSTYNVGASNFHSFSLIWEIQSSVGKTGGFLAEIMDTGLAGYDPVSYVTGSPLSSAAWEVSTDKTNWGFATEINPNNGTVAGISGDAKWIWADSSSLETVFLRVMFGQVEQTNGSNGTSDVPSTLDVTAVPEPGTILLLGAGLLGLAVCRRKAKK